MSFIYPFANSPAFAPPVSGANVLNYGADNTGTYPSNAQIQQCINAVAAIGGGIVFCPAGTYLLVNGLTLPSNITLTGAGWNVTTLKTVNSGIYQYAPAGSVPGIVGTGGQNVVNAQSTSDTFLHNITVQDLTIDASGTQAIGGSQEGFFGTGLSFININYSRATRVRIYNSASFGLEEGWVSFSGSTPVPKYPIVEGCIFDSCGRGGGADSLGGGVHTGSKFIGNIFLNCYGNAIDNLQIDGFQWTHNTIYSPMSTGTGRIQCDVAINNGVIAFNNFVGGTVNTPGHTTDNPTYGVPAGGILLGGGSGTSSHPPNNIVIEGNTFFGSLFGIVVQSAAITGGPTASTCTNIRIANNVFRTVWGYPAASPGFGNCIELYDADSCIVEGNICEDWNENLLAVSYTINGSGQVTATNRAWGVLFGAASLSSNGVTNSVVRNNTFKINVNNAAQAGVFCEMGNSMNNVFENNTISMPQSTRYIIRTHNQVSGDLCVLRNNRGLSWLSDTIQPTGVFPTLPSSTSTYLNQTGSDLIMVLVGGTMSQNTVNGFNLGATVPTFRLTHGSSWKPTYSGAPTLTVAADSL